MNILVLSLDETLLSPQPDMGDTLRRHIEYLRILRENDPEATLNILVRGAPRNDSPAPAEPGLSIHAVGGSAVTFLRGVARLGRCLIAKGPVHLITTQSPYLDGLAGVLLGRRNGIPVLVQLHGARPDDPYWLAESRANRLRAWWARRVLCRADAIRVVSPAAATWCRTQCPGVPVYTVPVALTLDLPDEPASPHTLTVLYVGRLVWQKNVPLLIEAFARVAERIPTARLLIVGDGPERPALEALANRLLPESRIVFAGAVPYQRIGGCYREGTVLAVPSRYEPYGRVFLEGMAHGLPIVATETEGARAILREPFAVVVPQNDHAALAEALLPMLSDPDLWHRMSSAAWNWVRTEYNPRELQRRWIETWARVAGGGS